MACVCHESLEDPYWGRVAARREKTLGMAVAFGCAACVKRLLSEGVDVERTDAAELGCVSGTPLHWTTMVPENLDVLDLLLQAGANVNALNDQFKTPLFYAVQNSRLKTVQKLLEAGAKVVYGLLNYDAFHCSEALNRIIYLAIRTRPLLEQCIAFVCDKMAISTEQMLRLPTDCLLKLDEHRVMTGRNRRFTLLPLGDRIHERQQQKMQRIYKNAFV